MAKQKNNLIMRSTRGMVGKQIVFKRRAGRSYVAAPPEVNENRKPTEKQQSARLNFKSSVEYATMALKDASIKKAYEAMAKKGRSAHNVAFQDAYTPPVVLGIIAQGYTGAIGNVIVVHAKDDFKVSKVMVSIRSAANVLIEEGPAMANADRMSWSYTTTRAVADVKGVIVKASAFDLPGNDGSLEVTV
jgi:hypothetical protein